MISFSPLNQRNIDEESPDHDEIASFGLNESKDHSFYEQFNRTFNNQQESQEDDENKGNYDSDIYFQQDHTQNQKENSELEKLKEVDNKKTKHTTITNPVKNVEEKKNEILIHKLVNDDIKNKPKNLLGKKKGRKKKGIVTPKDGEVVHSKHKEDNKMKKIKAGLNGFKVDLLNNSLEDKSYKFHKIDKSVSENLQRAYNLELNQRILSNIFKEEKVNGRYAKFSNAYLVNKILEEQKELETIKLLNLKYIEMVNLIQENYLDEFLASIKEKEKKEITNDNQNIDEYMESIKEIFLRYEDWFMNKKGRIRKKKIKEN